MTTPPTPPHDILAAATCHCRNGHEGCDCIEARVHAAELTALFNMRWKADMRAIKRWQAAHPDRANVWPDHADMVVWLMDELTKTPTEGDADAAGNVLTEHDIWKARTGGE